MHLRGVTTRLGVSYYEQIITLAAFHALRNEKAQNTGRRKILSHDDVRFF